MMIHGLGFLSLSASLVLPWALTGLVQGQKITESLVKDIRQSSTVQEMPLPSRKLISAVRTATTYYVSGTGNDRNSGLTTSSAFRTIQRAADLTDPGDTVLIMNGVYTNPPNAGTVVSIQRSGNAKAWIRYKAYPGHSPKIKHNTWSGIGLSNGASYIEINGLEIIGNNANISLAYALTQKWNTSNPRTNGSCISIDGRNRPVHHINILNNKVHNCGAGGISVMEADYVKVDHNTVFNNSWYSVYGNSGISLLMNYNTDNNRGYKMFVTNNKVYNNRMYIPWLESGTISDGNGIIVDVSKLGKNGAYRGRTLIANNISYRNGGSGIHAHESEHVDIVNNTAYANGQTPSLKKGQIYAGYSSDIKIFNNIIYASPGQKANSNMNNTNVTYDYNLYSKGVVIAVMGPHDIIGDPQFVNPSNADFRLKATSPAINRGYYWKDLKTDCVGNPRPDGGRYDIGAYEDR
ncbi:choice-of-anchor Q domain-containing protein [Nostoc sp. NOS(2021)]|uniref:choice-of-anchor Q domain-containing protein n=1 Tax=Nostoc sp. NOS(2021) TaxID=2815407 RepID=UPI0025FC1133|nr:choice-of-anchor Q domain-containing protein [Nostoc sp. NOS(2021)]